MNTQEVAGDHTSLDKGRRGASCEYLKPDLQSELDGRGAGNFSGVQRRTTAC